MATSDMPEGQTIHPFRYVYTYFNFVVAVHVGWGAMCMYVQMSSSEINLGYCFTGGSTFLFIFRDKFSPLAWNLQILLS